MEKELIGTEINFTEEKLMDILESLLFYENINRYEDETYNFITAVTSYIKNTQIDDEVKFTLCDYCTEIGDKASTYAFKLGFKEGVRLLRTMMNL